MERDDVQNDNQKSNSSTLPEDDFSFVFLPCGVPYFHRGVCGGAEKYRNKIAETFQEMPE